MSNQSLPVSTPVVTTKPLREIICFPSGISIQDHWMRSYLKENSWTSECPHENSYIVTSKNGKEIELARKQIDMNVDGFLKCTYYHFAAFAIFQGEKRKIVDSDYLCFGLEDFKTHINRMVLFFTLHDIELNILAE